MRNKTEPRKIARSFNRVLARNGAFWLTILCAAAVNSQTLCDSETIVGWGSSPAPIRVDSNHVKTYGQSWTTGDTYLLWTPHEGAWQQLNGNSITTEYISNNTPGSTAQSNWTSVLNSTGPGTYRDYSDHWFVPAPACTDKTTINIGYTTGSMLAIVRPTVNGVSAFWWLGRGVLSDHGYYAQSALTPTPNGATGSPYWSVQTVSGGGSVSLNCSVCVSNTITSTAPSSSCNNYDVTISESYGGFNSDPFKAFINKPASLSLQPLYPSDSIWGVGFKSVYQWKLTDTCGGSVAGLDGNEQFGPWTDDYFLGDRPPQRMVTACRNRHLQGRRILV
jgi:hypothetical protein